MWPEGMATGWTWTIFSILLAVDTSWPGLVALDLSLSTNHATCTLGNAHHDVNSPYRNGIGIQYTEMKLEVNGTFVRE